MPLYGVSGLLILAVSELAMLARVEPFWSWHTPLAWTGYILVVDALVYTARGTSWLTRSRKEFVFLALASIPLWLVFEGYNLLIRNWHYVNLPENTYLRCFGYAWAFATIWPGIFETAELVAVARWKIAPLPNPQRSTPDDRQRTIDVRGSTILVVAGAAMLIWPIVRPSPFLAAPVFLGFIFLLDPLNAQAGDESLWRGDRVLNLVIAGFVCGFLWEFWNYWARSKWIYTVPILQNVKIFEMPVLGYFGFPAFALECFTMYVLLRRLVWRGPVRPIGVLPAY